MVSILILMDSLFLRAYRFHACPPGMQGLNPYFNGFTILTITNSDYDEYTKNESQSLF